MSVLVNTNRKACLRLAVRAVRANRVRSFFLCASVFLVTVLYTVVFYTADSVQNSYLLKDQQEYGSTSHIVFDGLSAHQAERIRAHELVADAVELHSIGMLSDELLEYRSIRLAAADQEYAQTVSAVPEAGRMPEREGEIALDTKTLDSLGIPHRTGTELSLRWKNQKGEERQDTFTLCGYWSGETMHTESCAWIAPEEAERLLERSGKQETITLGVTLHRPKDLEEQAKSILRDLGLGDLSYTTNLSYNSARMDTANQRAISYLFSAVFVVAGGFLLIYNIMIVDLRERAALLCSMKALGMTPRQAGLFTSFYALLLCAVGVPFGLVAGFFIFYHLAGGIIVSLTGLTLNRNLLQVYPAVLSVGCAVLISWAGCFVSTCRMNGWMPAQIQAFFNQTIKRKKRRRKETVTVTRMALGSLGMRRRSFFAAALSLLVASLVLGASYIRYISYDAGYYADEMYLNDYSFIDASCEGEYQRYNEQAGNLTQEMGEQIRSFPGVEEYGEFLTHEVKLTADDRLRNLVVDYYNETDPLEGNMTKKETMEGQPDWIAGLDRLEQTGVYSSVLIGAEGLAMDTVLYYEPLDGTFDPELFETGDYVLAVGVAAQDGLSAAPAGTKVTIGKKTFTVMANLQEWGMVPAGQNSREAAFCLNYVMPADTLREQYPETNIRQIVVNIDSKQAGRFEKAIEPFKEDEGVYVERKQDEIRKFQQSAAASVSVPVFTGLLLFGISLLGFLNVMITKVLARYHDFALYQSLGMQKKQIRKMLLVEGLIHAVISLTATMPAAAVILWYGMAAFYNSNWAYISNNDWAVTYVYSVWPLAAVGVVILLICLLVPQLCLEKTEKESIVERMRIRES